MSSSTNLPDPDESLEDGSKWEKIQDQIEQEYQRKLKQVNDEAFNKMKTYEMERQELIEKAEYLK